MDKDELPKWLSPDRQFADALQAIPASLASKADQQHATAFIENVLSQARRPRDSAIQFSVPALASIELAQFRNIVQGRLDLAPPSSSAIKVNVFQGPNGTGKSSLFEAMSIAFFGTSLRHVDYLEDQDIKPSDRDLYTERVIRRFGAEEKPSIKLGSAERLGALANTLDEARARLEASSGTLLSQEEARQFVLMDDAGRGAKILGSYSHLASSAQQVLNDELERAKSAWQDTLRNMGLNASITKRETINNRLTQKLIDERVPKGADTISLWLEVVGELRPDIRPASEALALRWMRLDSPARRDEVAGDVAIGHAVVGTGRDPLKAWLAEQRQVLSDVAALEVRVTPTVEAIKLDWEQVRGDLETWATWAIKLRSRPPAQAVAPAPQAAAPVTAPSPLEPEEKIAAGLREMEANGKLLRARAEQLEALTSRLLPTWQERHPHQCPTCDHIHDERIGEIVARIGAETANALETSREAYAKLSTQLKLLQAQRAAAGESPVSLERQAAIAKLLNMPLEGAESLAARLLKQPQDWPDLLVPLQTLIAGPSLPAPMDPLAEQSLVDGLISQLTTDIEKTEQRRVAPDRWAELKKRTDAAAVSVLAQHLPSTLEAVWREIALALAPARWNQQASPGMKLELQRGNSKLGLLTPRGNDKSIHVPVRHVLNQSEQHVLGLAWFFTRHLTHGRFLTPLLALDDPAQEMDQTTYRRFVRFLQAFARAHNSTDKPLTLITFLHQEDRALEMARAVDLDGELTMLSWSPAMRMSGPDANVRRVRLRNPEQRAPTPEPLRAGQPARAAAD